MKRSDPHSLLEDLPPESEILIIRLRSLGDLVLETPAIAALHAWRPDLRISILVEPRFASVFEGNPAVSQLIPSREFFATARELRRHHFPAVFNQHGGPRSALLTAASGSPRRVCWKGFQFSSLYNVQVPDAKEFYGNPIVHAVEHRISQFYSTGLPRGPIPRAQVFPQAAAIDSVAGALAQGGVSAGAPYAVLQPGGRLAAMRWPVEKFAEIARWLREKHGIASVVNLGPGDAGMWADVHRTIQNCFVPANPLNVRELIALIAGARLFIGNDSGPAHIAGATSCRAVVVYGPTNPVQWHPWQTEHRAIHTGAVFHPRRGNQSEAESEPRPISTIGVDEVQSACQDLLT
ncbi:MAG TPA: glycosyltransferase family 9 protein [Candidatus Acidoferrum sp.]|nr:glycosyltransferase family 9 protein [Candidatus Acidoferrum sp.]